MSRVLTIVGASVRAAASSAIRAGFSVHAGDLFADVDLRRYCQATPVSDYPAGLAAICGGPQPGNWMYTGGLENEPTLVDDLARIRPLLGNRGDTLRAIRDPSQVAAALEAAGLPSPQVALDLVQVPRDGSWLRKPLRSAGGARIVVLDRHLTTDSPAVGPDYFQQRMAGDSWSAVFVAADMAARLLGVTRQLIGNAWCGGSGFRYCGSLGPLVGPPGASSDFAAIGDVLARQFGLVGLFGVDAIVNSSGVWPVEVNPRYPASAEILDRAHGISSVALHVAACEAGQLPTEPLLEAKVCCGKAIVFASRRCVISEELAERLSQQSEQSCPTVADVPAPRAVIEGGWPIVTVLAEGADEAHALAQLRSRAGEVLASVSA